MVQTLQQVNSAIARIQSTLPSTAADRNAPARFREFSDSGLQPHLGQSSANAALGTGHLRTQAAPEPAERRGQRSCAGRAAAGISGHARPRAMLRAHVALQDILDAVNHTNLIDSPGLLSRNHQLFLGLVTAQVQTPEQIGDIVIKSVNDVPVRIRDIGTVGAFDGARLTPWSPRMASRPYCSASTASPTATPCEVANEVHQEIESLRSDASRRRRPERLLRPVQHRAGNRSAACATPSSSGCSSPASSSGCSCATWARRS